MFLVCIHLLMPSCVMQGMWQLPRAAPLHQQVSCLHPPSDASMGHAGYVAVALGCSFTTLEAAGILIFKNRIGPLFVDDARVSREVASVAPICAGYQVTDGIYGVASGVLR